MSQSQGPQNQGPPMNPPHGPPYPPQVWMLGGPPKKSIDLPVTSVFLMLFIISAVAHMTIFQLNRKHAHKFLMSALLFGFSMARVVTCTLRIASVSLPRDIPLGIAANIFTAAGVLIIFIVNLVFTQRIMRASHPTFGWHAAFSNAFKVLYALVAVMITMLITVTVQTFYTLNPNIRRIGRDIQLAGVTYFAFVSFLPIPIILFGLVIPRQHNLDKFGHGRWRSKIRILLLSSVLVSFGATYRATTSWMTPVPMTRPMPAYLHKAAFYVANFTVEIIVLFLYAILRVDQRFYIPNGAHGSGSYGVQRPPSQGGAAVPPTPEAPKVFSEEETFDEDEWAEEKKRQLEDVEGGTADSQQLATRIEGSLPDIALPELPRSVNSEKTDMGSVLSVASHEEKKTPSQMHEKSEELKKETDVLQKDTDTLQK